MIEIIPNWHPVFVHFPITFTTASVFFFVTARLFKDKPWATQSLTTGRWMLWAAAIFACIAAVFGWLAYNSVEHDEAGHLAMTTHAYWALSALFILIFLAVLDVRSWRTDTKLSYGFLILLVVTWSVVVSTAWHGGELVYRHGLGVMSLPEPEGQGHSHEHGEGHVGMPAHDEVAPHEDVHTPGHEGTAKGDLQHDAEPMSKTPAADGTGAVHEEVGHTHAPGAPPHKD